MAVKFRRNDICLEGRRSWPAVTLGSGAVADANAWVVVEHDGQWYAATWEYLRVGAACKPREKVNGKHVEKAPLDGEWHPRSGARVGLMVSCLARDPRVPSNCRERSNVEWVTWR